MKITLGSLLLVAACLFRANGVHAQLDSTDYYSNHTQVEYEGKVYRVDFTKWSKILKESGITADLILYNSSNTLQSKDMVNIHTGEVIKRDIQDGRIKTLNPGHIVEIIKDTFNEEELRLLKEKDVTLYIEAVVGREGNILEVCYVLNNDALILRQIPLEKYILLEGRMKKEIRNELIGYLRDNFEYTKNKRFRITFGDLEQIAANPFR